MVARRRGWFLRLLVLTGVGLLAAVVLGGWMWLVLAALVLVTVGYTALLRHLKLQRDQARAVVRGLHTRQMADPRDGAANGATGQGRPAPDAGEGQESVIPYAPVEDGGLALQSVRLRRWDS